MKTKKERKKKASTEPTNPETRREQREREKKRLKLIDKIIPLIFKDEKTIKSIRWNMIGCEQLVNNKGSLGHARRILNDIEVQILEELENLEEKD